MHANGKVQNFDILLIIILQYTATFQCSQNFWQKQQKIYFHYLLFIVSLHAQHISAMCL